MADIYLDALDVHRALAVACKRAGSQKSFAESHNLSTAYVNEVLHGRKDAGDGILDALGLMRVVRYKRVNLKTKQAAS